MRKVIVIVGPTASGKTELGIQLSEIVPSEIISADSLQVYKHLDIGTAKPPKRVLERYHHHLIDILEPTEPYNAGMFSSDASKIIKSIYSKSKIPLIIGGTNLYINALINGILEVPEISDRVKKDVENLINSKGLNKCHKILGEIDPISASKIHPNDITRIQRALNVFFETGKNLEFFRQQQEKKKKFRPIFISIRWAREEIYERINLRVLNMIESGFIDEVNGLLNSGFSSKLKPLQSIGYKQVIDYLNKTIGKEEMILKIQQQSRLYAKKQTVWLKKNAKINFIEPSYDLSKVKNLVLQFLNEEC